MKKLINYCINKDQTIQEAMPIIQGNAPRCAVVVDANDKVVSVFTEGDVLRSMLKGISINTPLANVINPIFHYLDEVDMGKACEMIKKFDIISIPVLDKNFRLKDVITVFDMLGHLTSTSVK